MDYCKGHLSTLNILLHETAGSLCHSDYYGAIRDSS